MNIWKIGIINRNMNKKKKKKKTSIDRIIFRLKLLLYDCSGGESNLMERCKYIREKGQYSMM